MGVLLYVWARVCVAASVYGACEWVYVRVFARGCACVGAYVCVRVLLRVRVRVCGVVCGCVCVGACVYV